MNYDLPLLWTLSGDSEPASHVPTWPTFIWFGHIALGGLLCLMALPTTAAPAGDPERLAAADTGFAFGLLNQIYRAQPGTNIFLSPYSASTVLQMVDNGAAGSTRLEMERVLGTRGLDSAAMNRAHKDLEETLRSAASNVVFSTANAMWHRPGAMLKPEFVSLNTEYYGATLSPLDFTDPRSAGIVNAWAEQKTQGRIKNIVQPPLPGNTELLLANAIYFKGKWAKPFDAKTTREEPFILYGGGHRQVPMMRQTGRFAYLQGEGFQAVRLPYSGGHLGMCVLLPETNSTPAKLLARLDAAFWRSEVLSKLVEADGSVGLPKFRMDYGVELKPALMAMGMKLAFRGADFSRLSDSPLVLSKVTQKSFVDVNEEGTEAAAVTVAEIAMTAAVRRPPPFQMIVDRPFLFTIYDDLTKEVLFLGIVFEPEAHG